MNASTIITVSLGLVIGSAIGVAGYSGVIDVPMLGFSQADSDSSTAEGDGEGEGAVTDTKTDSVDEKADARNSIFDKAEAYLKKNPHDRTRAMLFGGTLVEAGEFERAEKFYLEHLSKRPKDSEFIHGLGWTYEKSKQWAKAAETYGLACEINIKNISASNNLAWVLATAPDESVRNGKRAVRFAKRAKQMAPTHPAISDTLAAAYAEAGDFENAVKVQRSVVKSSPAKENRDRLKLYQQGKPYRSQ